MLVDALIGMALLGLLIAGLHQLRGVQLRSVRGARARLAATETAASAALIASLAPDRATRDRLLSATGATITTAPQRVTAAVRWTAGSHTGVEEVTAVAPK